MDRRPQWDDEDDDRKPPPRRLCPDQIRRTTTGCKPSIVTWMYAAFGALILAQILRFYLD